MKILVGCEESQIVCMAFRKKGHKAYSCDVQDCSGKFPQYHLKMDIRKAIKFTKWDLIILHCPCTKTALCGNRHYHNSIERIKDAKFTKQVFDLAKKYCKKVVLEQPKTIMQKFIGQKSQVIQPWQFGHGETKETWLWIIGLPLLKPSKIVTGREQKIFLMPPSKDRGKLRSKTYKGIANAMAKQWG